MVVASDRNLRASRPAQVANFFAGDPAARAGARLARADATGSGVADLVVASGGGAVAAYAGLAAGSDAPTPLFTREMAAGPLGVFVG